MPRLGSAGGWSRAGLAEEEGRRREAARELVPGSAVENSAAPHPSAGAGAQPAPLVEEEGDVLRQALVAQLAHPLGIEPAEAGPALAAGQDPVDTGQVQAAERPDQRLAGEEAHVGARL